MNKLQHAQQFLKNGIATIPLRHRGKEPETDLIGGEWNQFTTTLPTEYELLKWLGSGWLNYGVVAGWQNLVIIDFDNMMWFDMWKLWAADKPEIAQVIEQSYKVQTSRGVHVYVRTEQPELNDKRIIKKGGIDIQAHNKFVVGPGCVHPSGTQYVAVGEFRLTNVCSVESILPVEFFPKIAPEPSCAILGHSSLGLSTADYPLKAQSNTPTEYDPFQAAMFANDVDLISKVKSMVRIEQFQWRELQRTSSDGRWLAALCPFHDDHKPSFWIDTARQLCGCATCGMKPMDVINLFARMRNVSESEAVSLLAREIGVWA